jgi:hypothetical protein
VLWSLFASRMFFLPLSTDLTCAASLLGVIRRLHSPKVSDLRPSCLSRTGALLPRVAISHLTLVRIVACVFHTDRDLCQMCAREHE